MEPVNDAHERSNKPGSPVGWKETSYQQKNIEYTFSMQKTDDPK
jgi:hypothetical protein